MKGKHHTCFAVRTGSRYVTCKSVFEVLKAAELLKCCALFVERSMAYARFPTVMNYTRAQPWRMTSEIELQMAPQLWLLQYDLQNPQYTTVATDSLYKNIN